MRYEEISVETLKSVVGTNIALIVTATDIETEATHNKLIPIDGYPGILKAYDVANTYYCGVFGKYYVVHVQSNMGSIGRSSAIMTISNAIRTLSPKFVIMIGVAFGIDEKKQNVGDVLIAESILPYDNKRVGKNITIQRGQQAPSSKTLVDRFKSTKTWQHLLPGSVNAKKVVSQVLSGEELIDNLERKNQLIEAFPNAKGGEMEGAGLFAACDGTVDWILVKGICDFADGKKGINKAENQEVAINSTVSLCLELFNSNHAFSALDLEVSTKEATIGCDCNHDLVEKVLFEVYETSKEEYYVAREIDPKFNNILDQYCVWIYGISGCGKTNLILRNLSINNIKFTPISLASCIDLDVVELFREILFDLEATFGKLTTPLTNDTHSNLCRNILSILEQNCSDKEYVIFIEEIPISTDEDYKEFVSHFFSLLILKKLKHGLNNVKFVLSSIKNPTPHITSLQQKIHQQVKFIEMKNWKTSDTDKLISLLSGGLNIELPDPVLESLKSNSENSPRFIKKFFRNILACCLSGNDDYESILSDTKRELKQYQYG